MSSVVMFACKQCALARGGFSPQAAQYSPVQCGICGKPTEYLYRFPVPSSPQRSVYFYLSLILVAIIAFFIGVAILRHMRW
jgi:hypothetical protein